MKSQLSNPNTIVFSTSSAVYKISKKSYQCLKLLLFLPSPAAIHSAVPYPLQDPTYELVDLIQVLTGQKSGQKALSEPHLLGSQTEHQLSHLFLAAEFCATFRAIVSVTPLLHQNTFRLKLPEDLKS